MGTRCVTRPDHQGSTERRSGRRADDHRAPRLVSAPCPGTESERNDWRLMGGGHGIHWKALDEDISVEGLLAGDPSGESVRSFEDWMHRRP